MNTYCVLAMRSLRLIEQLVFSRDFTVEPYKPIDDHVIQRDTHQGNGPRAAGSVLGIGGGGRKTKQNFQKRLGICREDLGGRDVSSRGS